METDEVDTARQDLRALATDRQALRQFGGGSGENVHARDDTGGQTARAGMAEVSAVHGQRAHAGTNRERRPCGQAEVGVDDVEALTPVAATHLPGAAYERVRAWGHLEQLRLDPIQAAQRVDLVAYEAPARGMGAVGQHVRDHERAHGVDGSARPCGMMARMNSGLSGSDARERPAGRDPGARPIAVFDSGVGGLTVLHELLVRLPREDYIYLGDTARFPYGQREPLQIERFAAEIAEELLHRGAKLLVVACNAATSAALPSLTARMRQTTLGVDVLGVVRPEAMQAVVATRSGRIGLLATPTTVASGAYERAIAAVDPHVTLHAVPCPTLASIIQAGEQFDAQAVATVRAACEPLRAASVDTVILGCTHYPLISSMLQRILGPDVTLVTSGAALARQVEHALSTRNLGRPATALASGGADRSRTEGEGEYRFLCTGDVEAFRELGTRFLQMPLGEVEHVELAAVGALA